MEKNEYKYKSFFNMDKNTFGNSVPAPDGVLWPHDPGTTQVKRVAHYVLK